MSSIGTLFAVASWNLYYDQPALWSEMRRIFTLRFAHASSSTVAASQCYDMVFVGGGIVGCATARQLSLNKPNLRMALLEKEANLGTHQTGHNSGVIHAGIYYKPGSLKARLCVEGCALAYQYLEEKKIPYKRVGKLIVACDSTEADRLMDLWDRALQNKVPGVRLLQTPQEIADIEPNCVGLKAIWSPNTGIVDWAQVNRSYAADFEATGGQVLTNFEVSKFKIDDKDNGELHKYPLVITARDGRQVRSRYVITAAGLQSDKIAKLTHGASTPQIVPFRGEYLVLNKGRSNIVQTNIYPVPDPRFPFLGVHFTPRMDGTIWLGPNAVLAFAREGYRFRDISPSELFETLLFSGFRKLAWRYAGAGIGEFHRSLSIRAQVKQLQRFVPSITVHDIDRSVRCAGIRAQALDADGSLVDDFIFELDQASGRILHVRNAPSPGATSSLAIAKVVAARAETEFGL